MADALTTVTIIPRSLPAHAAVVVGLTAAQIQAAVCAEFDIPLHRLLAPRRDLPVVRPRQVAMYLCRELTGMSLPTIGKRFLNRDHTTVLHSIARVTELMASDPAFAARVTTLEQRLRAPEMVEV